MASRAASIIGIVVVALAALDAASSRRVRLSTDEVRLSPRSRARAWRCARRDASRETSCVASRRAWRGVTGVGMGMRGAARALCSANAIGRARAARRGAREGVVGIE